MDSFLLQLKKTMVDIPRFFPQQPLHPVQLKTSIQVRRSRWRNLESAQKKEFSAYWDRVRHSLNPKLHKVLKVDHMYRKHWLPYIGSMSEWCTNNMHLIVYREAQRIDKQFWFGRHPPMFYPLRQLRCLPYKRSQKEIFTEIEEVKRNPVKLPYLEEVNEFEEMMADL